MKRLLIVTSSYFPSNGGVERHVRQVAAELRQADWRITIFVRYKEGYPRVQTVDNTEVYRLPKSISYKSLWLWSKLHPKLFKAIDVVHSHDFYPDALHKILTGVRWVHTFHGYEGYPVQPEAIITRKHIVNQVDKTVAVGKFIEKWYQIKCDKVIYGAAQLSESAKLKVDTKWDAVFIGRLEEDTGFKYYLKAFGELSKQNNKLSMAVLGDGSQTAWAKNFVKKNNLKVEFKGMVDSVYDFIPFAKTVFVSSYLGIIEASLCKKPVIAYYDTPIKKDYLELHPMAKGMAIVSSVAGIVNVFNDPIKLKNNAIMMLAWAKQQTWVNVAGLYAELYRLNKEKR